MGKVDYCPMHDEIRLRMSCNNFETKFKDDSGGFRMAFDESEEECQGPLSTRQGNYHEIHF